MLNECERHTIISWEGIRIVENVTDGDANPGVVTLEGRIGPLLKGDASQAHFIEMPGDLFCHEHTHTTESLIFTVKGSWVLCSPGRRQFMRPGSLFWFKAGTPTGYEVPFAEAAFILIFRVTETIWTKRALCNTCKACRSGLRSHIRRTCPSRLASYLRTILQGSLQEALGLKGHEPK